MAVADRHGLPVAVGIASATPNEVTLVEDTLDQSFLNELPERLIGDRAYDSNKLDQRLLEQRGVIMIAPNIRRSHRHLPPQDGRPLRRYRRRWKVERLFAWLHNFRRLVVRWDRHAANFLGFLRLACIVILLRAF
jgi:transposase